MSDVYSFRPGPSFRTASPADMFSAAMDQPMSIMSTLTDQAKGGVLESFGLGTAIRDLNMPEEAPTRPDVVVTPEEGAAISLPDTASTRRRQTIVNTPAGGGQAPAPVLESPDQFQQRRVAAKALDEDQYKASAFFRKDIPWDPGMTEDRAAVLASFYDAKKVREFYAEKRPIASFLGNLAGQALDPINYIPIVGPEVRAASIARFGALKSGAALGALDAAANTAAASVATLDARRSYGDDVSWQTTISQIATAALIGGAFGTLGGALGERADVRNRKAIEERMSTLKTTQEARVALNEAIGGLARDGEIKLSPNAVEPVQRIATDIERQPVVQSVDEVGSPTGHTTPIETPEFKSWFGESKVADSEGKPLVVYHGTKSEFDQFDIKKFGTSDEGLAGKGFYFTYNPDEAHGYAQNEMFGRGDTPNVISAYVSLQNPLVITDMKLPDGRKVMDLHEGFINSKGGAAVRQIAEESGHDGVVFARRDGGIGHVVAFEPTQIKSVKNTGAFDKSNPSITDASPPKPEPIPEGRTQAESSIAKPDDYKAMAAQYRIDPETGSYHEEPDIKQLEAEGRLTDEDKASLDDAQKTYENGSAYGDALKAAVGCMI